MTGCIAVLPDRGVIAVEGAEAVDFLHALLTCDVKALAPGQGAYGALLTPQGKILFDLFTVASDTGLMLDAAASSADDLARRLMMYRLRRKIEIARRPDLGIAAIWDCEAPPDIDEAIVLRDPRTGSLGYRAIGLLSRLEAAATVDAARYHAHRMALGIADSDRDIKSGQLFPHEANLDQLHGVNFSKGCYVGQEVVSRMEHRGTARSRIVPVRFDGPPPAPGTGLAAGGRSLGTVLSSLDGRGLAIIRLDRAENALAAGETIVAGETPMVLERPQWARFPVPGTETV
jgi:tRNA-modifying protein YgfZ